MITMRPSIPIRIAGFDVENDPKEVDIEYSVLPLKRYYVYHEYEYDEKTGMYRRIIKLCSNDEEWIRNKIEQLKARGIEFKITSMPIGVCVVYELESVRYKPEIPLV